MRQTAASRFKFAHKSAGVTRNIVIDKDGKIAFLTRLFDKDEFERRCDDLTYDYKTALKQLKDLNNELGVGALKIVPKISHYLYEMRMFKKLNEKTECKIRLYMLEGFNFA